MDTLSPEELSALENAYPDGLTSAQIIDFFQDRGVRLSEATFRKYVQLGLLPRSRRVGAKGKHRGSRGLYPADTIRRIHAIKGMMELDLTLEQIQRSFFGFKNRIEAMARETSEIISEFEDEIRRREFRGQEAERMSAELQDIREQANRLIDRIERTGSRIVAGPRPGGGESP
ncbi:MAG: hypothetical protein GMKNLPBB_02340 [Myxococcota bacterium]|nr:hypothetical protein [Myxococcota bacterium]